MFRVLGVFVLSLLPAAACKWDRDTLKEEAKGKLDTVKAITGWFDRYPPRYYEMRLERVTHALKDKPGLLDLYDDAGVACDRLGRHDEAIAWMARKNAVLEGQPASAMAVPRYRYLANLGSFHMDRWISRPPEIRNKELGDLLDAEKFVTEAIALNPDAHFGRERYQLQMIRWLLSSGSADAFPYCSFLVPTGDEAVADSPEAHEKAVAGMTGLILLGEGWMSPDVFSSLSASLTWIDDASVAELAYCRVKELHGEGIESLHPVAEFRDRMASEPSKSLREDKRAFVRRYFSQTRAAAESRRVAWLAYQELRFERGLHPDTHPDFWSGWREPGFPKMPGRTPLEWAERNPVLAFVTLCALAVVGFIGFCRIVRWLLGARGSKVAAAS